MRERRRNIPDVAISQKPNELDCIRDALDLIQAGSMINSNDVVVITPNFVQQKTPETGIVVGTDSLREIICFVKEQNPRRIVIATGSGGVETNQVMRNAGFDQITAQEQVEFVDLNHGPFKKIKLNHQKPEETNIHVLYDEMTFLISYTQLKIHEEATMSAAIKNIALGWPPAEEHGHPKKNLGIHDDLHGFIHAMAQAITIDLSIVSGCPAMIGTGPGKGLARYTDLVAAGTDPVSVDTVCARLLGFKPQAISYLYKSIYSGVGIGDIEKMNIRGLSLADAEKAFSQAAYGESFSIDLAYPEKKLH